MKKIVTLSQIDDRNYPAALVVELGDLYPAGIVVPGVFCASVPEDSPVASMLLRTLEKAGFSARVNWHGRVDRSQEFVVHRYRRYEPSDFEGVALFELWPSEVMKSEWHERRVTVRHDEVRHDVLCARGNEGLPIMVHDKARSLIQRAGFHEAQFKPIRLMRATSNPDDDPEEDLDWSDFGGPWWIIDSSVRMPRLSPFLQRIGRNGEVLPREAQGRIREPGFDDVELHYVRGELDAMGPFDIAREFESQGLAKIVVSKRFYEFCRDTELGCAFKPVRIDEG